MYTIEYKAELSPDIKLYIVKAPMIARRCLPGQFVMLRIDEYGERIPLTIADFNRELGTITLIFQEVGRTTRQLGQLNRGDTLIDLAGPLGKASHIENFGTVVCIGGGIGIAPLYPIARAYKQAGNTVNSIIGARRHSVLILEDEMRTVSNQLYITTDDGSKGNRGLVTDPLRQMIADGEKIDLVVAIGPVIMMRSVAEVTRPLGIPTIVSLNPVMVDGTGMCGGCRVNIGNQNKFACVDGPEFDAHQVDFDGLMIRQRMYHEEERMSKRCGEECTCHR